MTDLVSQELERRPALWQTLIQTGETQKVNPQRLRELGIYGGAEGIWIDKDRTRRITATGVGVTVGLLRRQPEFSTLTKTCLSF